MYAEAANTFGLVHPRLTPHGLRRGGATWHFCLLKSYDATMALGRWSQIQTARLYIDEAVCEEVDTIIPAWGKEKLVLGVKALPTLLMRALQHP